MQTLADAGLEVCFANPGTTEMGIVAALEREPRIRCVLGLFEGVCSGMADGYYRMAGKPAMVLLHCGAGLGNAIANLHNANRARSGSVVVVGDHPDSHLPFDPPLASKLDLMAESIGGGVRRLSDPNTVGAETAEAVRRARLGSTEILLAPMDVMSDETGAPGIVLPPSPQLPDAGSVDRAAKALTSGAPAALLLSGKTLRAEGLRLAGRISKRTGCRVLCDCFPARLDRGAGLPLVDRIPYFPELVLDRLKGLKHIVLAEAPAPVSFFKYPGSPHSTVPDGCEVINLADDDATAALRALAERLAANADGPVQEATRPVPPTGALTTHSIGLAIGAALPEGAIISDESATSGGPTYFLTQGCPPHSSMYLTGGAIGFGLPAATGAAIACPDRPVIALQADGSGMYTLQALWTQAREGLNVTTVIFANDKYNILQVELGRSGVTAMGPKAESMMTLTHPSLDWAALAKGMGVPAATPRTAEEFHDAFTLALREAGPHVIVARI